MAARWTHRLGHVAILAMTAAGCAPRNATPPAPAALSSPNDGVRAPSFGQGTELPLEAGQRRRWRRPSIALQPPLEVERSPALAASGEADAEGAPPADRDRAAVTEVGRTEAGPPEPPPTGAGTLVRTIYQLQAQIYALRLLLDDPRIEPQLLSRVAAAMETGDRLVRVCQENPDCETGAQGISRSLATLHSAAKARDDATMHALLEDLLSRLARLRAAVSP